MPATIVMLTCEEILEGNGIEEVHSNADSSWRYGCYMYKVFNRVIDGTFWGVKYRISWDGETDGLRDGDAKIAQVWRVEKTTFDYVTKEPQVKADGTNDD